MIFFSIISRYKSTPYIVLLEDFRSLKNSVRFPSTYERSKMQCSIILINHQWLNNSRAIEAVSFTLESNHNVKRMHANIALLRDISCAQRVEWCHWCWCKTALVPVFPGDPFLFPAVWWDSVQPSQRPRENCMVWRTVARFVWVVKRLWGIFPFPREVRERLDLRCECVSVREKGLRSPVIFRNLATMESHLKSSLEHCFH